MTNWRHPSWVFGACVVAGLAATISIAVVSAMLHSFEVEALQYEVVEQHENIVAEFRSDRRASTTHYRYAATYTHFTDTAVSRPDADRAGKEILPAWIGKGLFPPNGKPSIYEKSHSVVYQRDLLSSGWPARAFWCEIVVMPSTKYRTEWTLGGVNLAEPNSMSERLCGIPIRPRWSGVFIDVTVFSLAALAAFHGTVVLRAAYRQSKGRCPACGYVLISGHDAGCPECGWNRPGHEPAPAVSGDVFDSI